MTILSCCTDFTPLSWYETIMFHSITVADTGCVRDRGKRIKKGTSWTQKEDNNNNPHRVATAKKKITQMIAEDGVTMR